MGSAAMLGANTVTGQKDGSIYLWQGRNCQKACAKKNNHNGPVTTLFTLPKRVGYGVLSAGKDGIVKRWDRTLQCTMIMNLNTMKKRPLSVCIQSVCAHDNKILVGTKSSQIYERDLDATDDVMPTLIHQGHFKGETWGLACHPKQERKEFITCGDDKTVRLWDSVHRSMVTAVKVKSHARAVAYAPDAAHVAVGLCSGHVIIYNERLTKKIKGLHVSKQWIQDIKFSPSRSSSSLLAVASHDNHIYLYDRKTYVRTAVCKGHSSYVTHIDFSSDGRFLQSNCGAYELLFWDTETGRQKRSASELRDVKWDTWSCVLGWPVQGIFQEEQDGTDINAVHRSPNSNLLLTADDSGKVNLFRYPAVKVRTQSPKKHKGKKKRRRRGRGRRSTKNAHGGRANADEIGEAEARQGSGYKTFKGHSSHVTNIRFMSDGQRVISTGGGDKCVFQWKLKSGVKSRKMS